MSYPGLPRLERLNDLKQDWLKPRYALPSLRYFHPWISALAIVYGAFVLIVLLAVTTAITYDFVSRRPSTWAGEPVPFVYVVGMIALLAAAGVVPLRRIFLRLRLRRDARRLIVINQPQTTLSPIEAGVMIDAYSNDHETAVMLTGLSQKGIIRRVRIENHDLPQYNNSPQLSADEKVFVQVLFEGKDYVLLRDALKRYDPATRAMRQAAYERLVSDGDMPVLSPGRKIVYFITTALVYPGIITGVLVTILFIVDGPSATADVPASPDERVAIWQLIYAVVLAALVVAIPLQAYFNRVFSQDGLEKYRQAAGLYMYIKVGLHGRFTGGQLAPSEHARYLPYAQAFGLEPATLPAELEKRVK